MWASGNRIGDWVLERCIGEGGMGEVWLAHSAVSERLKAAVKVMKHSSSSERDRTRFVREIEALARLNHPSVVRVLGWGEDEVDTLFLAMEWVDGTNLLKKLATGPMPPDKLLVAMAAFTAGLRHAHEGGLAHRDIKPANLMLAHDGSMRILDFGIAFDPSQTRLTGVGMVTGTGSYLPPEALEGEIYNPHQGDVYALGVVMYEALTAAPGFRLDKKLSPAKRVLKLLEDKRSRPLDPGDGFKEDVRELVRRATEPDPKVRFGSAAEFEAAIEVALAARSLPKEAPPKAPTPAPAPRVAAAPQAAASNWSIATAIAGVGAGLLGVALIVQPILRGTTVDSPVAMDFHSVPDGAHVRLDGIAIGETPIVGHYVPAGQHHVLFYRGADQAEQLIVVGPKSFDHYMWKGDDAILGSK